MEDGNRKSRLLWMDVIKVVSTFLIVMNHSISYSFTTLPVDGYEWKIVNFIFMISRMGLPVFIMCSGAGMLVRKRTIKEIWCRNILGLLISYVGWMSILGIWDVVRIWIEGENASLRVLVNAFAKCILFGKYHTWFIFTLVGLYAVTPFLYMIVQEKKNLCYFQLLAIVFTIVLPLFSGIEKLDRLMAVVDSINMHFVVGYSLYFVTGYFIVQYLDHKWEKYAEIAFLLSAGSAYVCSVWMSLKTGGANQDAYGVFSPCGFLMSVFFMILFKKYIGEKRQGRVVNGVASLQKYGIAIYLLHVIFVEIWTKGSGMIYVLVAVLIWVLALGISVVAYRIPIVGQILFIRRKEKE